jgi:hypothetical protein
MNALAIAIQPFVKERKKFLFLGVTHEYLVVDAEFGKQHGVPNHFTICKNGVLAVSDEYPEQYRELGLIHELIEHSLPQSISVCKDALIEELILAEERNLDLAEYIEFRTEFFEKMLAYYKGQDASPLNTEFVNRLTQSVEHLRSYYLDRC